MKLSIIIPIHNEEENLRLLYAEVLAALEPTGSTFEVIAIDDGSTDRSGEVLAELAAGDDRLIPLALRRNFGQTAAIQAGFEIARGEILVTIDGDLQNDPADIPRLLAEIERGADLVHGWRQTRHDRFFSRRLPSMIANRLISSLTRFPIHDLGCTLKAMRREITDELELYGEMHRFIPILAHARGARCVELVTQHRPRRFGTSKYGLARTVRVLLDLLTVKYMIDYFDRPMRLFGRFGLACGFIAILAGIATVAMKLYGSVDMTGNPLLLLAILSLGLGVQFFSLGLLGEVAARIYYERDRRRPFAFRRELSTQASSPLPNRSAA